MAEGRKGGDWVSWRLYYKLRVHIGRRFRNERGMIGWHEHWDDLPKKNTSDWRRVRGKLGRVAHAHNTSTQEAEVRKLWVPGQPGLYNKTLPKKKKKKSKISLDAERGKWPKRQNRQSRPAGVKCPCTLWS
jgi:hypothetical protein